MNDKAAISGGAWMPKNFSLAVFAVLVLFLLALVWLHTGSPVPPSGTDAIWFHAGLFTLLIGRFIIEYRFTKPNDVFVNCMVVFASTSTLTSAPHQGWWDLIRWGSLVCGAGALALAWDPGREARLESSRIRIFAYHLVTGLGRAEVIYSIVFLLALLSYFDLDTTKTKALVIFWGVILLAAQVKAQRLGQIVFARSRVDSRHIIGIAHSFLAPSIVFGRKLPGQKARLHEVVGFTQSSATSPQCYGIIIGERSSASEVRYAVALLNETIENAEINDRTLVVSSNAADLESANPPIDDAQIERLQRMIGTVSKGTNISQLKFELFGSPQISLGSLLEIDVDASQVFYQVFDGLVDEETALADSDRAFVEGFAEQVGVWSNETGGFETYDWVAKERAMVFKTTENEPAPDYALSPQEITVGRLPRSNYPVNVDIDKLILYHTAILGVTGSGKSFLTFKLVEEAAARGVKVVCIDPTGDYQRYLAESVLLDVPGALAAFLDSPQHRVGIIETANAELHPVLQTLMVTQKCLEWCKANRGHEDVLRPKPKILVVLEEAHLLIPEWNFNPDKAHQDNVSRTSQIVLQARKYGLGFLVVGQRTANIVKSVLNQCNTVVSFQAFDDTSFEFLKNYMGAFHVRSLPNLKPWHGIIVGKASNSQRPLMVHLDEQDRLPRQQPAPAMEIEPVAEREIAEGADRRQ